MKSCSESQELCLCYKVRGPRAASRWRGPLELFLVFTASKTHPTLGRLCYGVHVDLLGVLL